MRDRGEMPKIPAHLRSAPAPRAGRTEALRRIRVHVDTLRALEDEIRSQTAVLPRAW